MQVKIEDATIQHTDIEKHSTENTAPAGERLAARLARGPRRLARSKLVWTLGVLLLLYTAGGFLLAPYLIERYVPSLAQRYLGRDAVVHTVSINPYLLTVEASGFRLQGEGKAPLLTFDRLFVDFDATSVFKRAWSFSDVELTGADLALVIDRNGHLNLSELLERLRKPAQPDQPGTSLVVDHLAVHDSRVSLADLSGASPATAAVTGVDFELRNFGTVADAEGHYVLDARLPAGGKLATKGTVALEPLAISGEVTMSAMKLDTAWQFLRDDVHIARPSGALTLSGNYAVKQAQGETDATFSGVEAKLADFAVALRGAERPLIALRSATVSNASFALGKHELVVQKVVLAQGAINAAVSESGTPDWQRLTAAAPATVSKDASAQQRTSRSSAQPWHVRFGEIAIEKLGLAYDDRSRNPALVVRSDIPHAALGLDVTTAAAPTRIVVDDIAVALADTAVTAAGSGTPQLAFDALRIDGGRVDTAAQSVRAKHVGMQRGDIKLAIGPAGPEGLLKALSAPSQRTSGTAPPRDTAEAASGAKPWHIQLDDVAIEKVALAYDDHGTKPALTLRTSLSNAGFKIGVTTGAGPTQIIADNIGIALAGTAVNVAGSETRQLALDVLAIDGGRVDTKAQSVHAKRIDMKRGDIKLAVGPAGPEGLLKALSAGSQKDRAAAPAPRRTQALASGAQPWHVQVDKIAIDNVGLRYKDTGRGSPLELSAASVDADLNLDAVAGAGAARIVAGNLQLGIEQIALAAASAKKPAVTLDSLKLAGGRVDTGRRLLAANDIVASGGGMRVVRGPTGAFELLDALVPQSPGRGPVAANPTKAPTSATWQYRIGTATLKGFGLGLIDRTFKPALTYDARMQAVTLKNIDSDSGKPIAFTAQIGAGKDGTVNGEGTLSQDFGGADARLRVSGITLTPLQPLLAKYARLDLSSGRLSAETRVTYRRGGAPQLLAKGRIGIDDFLVNESDTGKRFASWKTLAADGVELSLSPDRATVRQVRVLEPGAKIVVAEDRTTNLTKILRTQPASSPASSKARAQTAPEPAPPAAFPWDIGRVRFDDGVLDYADLSLVLPFATQVQALNGAIVGLSSDPDARAQLELKGQVGRYGEARADGALIPRDPRKFMDITARFNNVSMPLLTPYSATFAGRKIAAGKLSLVLEYKINDSQLSGENRIALSDFKLGERVEAPNAMDLPLDLAVALLKDSEGRIRLEVPVSGNVGNPEFDYGKVIRAAVRNAIKRVVTAPFRAIAGLFGKHNAEEVRTVSFAAGSAAIDPAQREQLDALARALKARPQLKVLVKGPYDPESDTSELKRNAARLALARAMHAQLGPGEEPAPIAFDRRDTRQALERLLEQRAGPQTSTQLAELVTQRLASDRAESSGDDGALYQAIFALLVKTQPLPDTAARVLAARRARAIIEALAKAGIDGTQLQQDGIIQVESKPDNGIATQLALEARPGAS